MDKRRVDVVFWLKPRFAEASRGVLEKLPLFCAVSSDEPNKNKEDMLLPDTVINCEALMPCRFQDALTWGGALDEELQRAATALTLSQIVQRYHVVGFNLVDAPRATRLLRLWNSLDVALMFIRRNNYGGGKSQALYFMAVECSRYSPT